MNEICNIDQKYRKWFILVFILTQNITIKFSVDCQDQLFKVVLYKGFGLGNNTVRMTKLDTINSYYINVPAR